jgi:hypothetical protein
MSTPNVRENAMNLCIVKVAGLGLLTGVLACVGCKSSLPPVADAQQARAAMETALDTWQRGEARETLSTRTPPILFTDLHWAKGYRLVKYEIAKEEPRGQSRRLTVKLSLESKEGQRREATTVYLADTQPSIVIVPEM